MDFLSSGDLQNWIFAVIENNAKLIGLVYGILKYFSVTTGSPQENKILDLVKRLTVK